MNKAELIARQMADGLNISNIWGNLLYNVKAYGAKGDGVKDDTTAIQKTIAAADLVGGSVFFPEGKYIVSTILNITSNVKRFFAFGDVKLNFTPSSGGGILIAGTTNFTMSGLGFTQNVVNSGNMIVLSQNTNATIELCRVDTTGGQSFALTQNTTVHFRNCYFYDTGRTSLGVGHPSKAAIWVGEAPTFTNVDINIIECTFKQTNWSGVYFFPQGGTIDKCKFYSCGESSVFTSYYAKNIKLTNNYVESAHIVNVAGFGFEIGAAQHVLIDNNEFYNCDEAGIGAGDLKDFVISNNICHHNGKGLGSTQNKAGIVLRQTVADPNTTERGIITGNHCYDEFPGGQKVQLYGLSTSRIAGSGTIKDVNIVGNFFNSNATSPVFFVDETTVNNTVFFKNNVGFGDRVVTKEITYPTAIQVFDVVGFGFRPSAIRILTWLEGTNSYSECTFSNTDTNATVVGVYKNSTLTRKMTGAVGLLVNDADATKTYCTLTQFLNDGVRLSIGGYNGPLTVKLLVTAYP